MVRFLVYGIIILGLLMLGGLSFFYVEHCRDVKAPKRLSTGEDSFVRICEDLNKLYMNNTTKDLNDTSSPPSAELKHFLNNVVSICKKNKRLVLDDRVCELTVLEWFKWTEYTITVAFTIGEWLLP